MNKGLFIHLAVTIFIIIAGLFIVGSEEWGMEKREFLVGAIVVGNIFTCFACNYPFIKSPYSEKIKL